MLRPLPLLLLLLPVACDEKPAKAPAKIEPRKPVVLPTTGNPRIRGMREGILEEVEKAEKEMESGNMPSREFVERWKKGADNCVTVAQMAVDAEAKLTVERELAALRQKQAELDKRQADLAEGIQEINGYLAEIQRGGKPPEGFTEGELKDRLGDHQEQARALDKEEEELRARMKEKEEILAQGKVPPQDKTLHTQELEAAKELRARVGALEAKLK